jgi:hypothetical protein
MVVCMESWFLADKNALSVFFGQGFNERVLPQNKSIEAVSKDDLYKGMEQATRHCKTKDRYGKGKHSFEILSRIDPNKVRAVSPWAKRFLEILQRTIQEAR